MTTYVIAGLGLIVIASAIYAVFRRIDVRIALSVAALLLGGLAWIKDGNPNGLKGVILTFLDTLGRDKFIIPICSAMGFAYVLRQTGCDQHLVQLLVKPVRRFRILLIPGTVLVGFFVNIPIISQTSTAVTIGPVLVPLLRAGGISPITSGAALLLGTSIGGELLNPGAPEYRTVEDTVKSRTVNSNECVERVLPLVSVHLLVAGSLFWWISSRAEVKYRAELARQDRGPPESAEQAQVEGPLLEVNYFKAFVPLIPLILLFLTGPPLNLIKVPDAWLLKPTDDPSLRGSRLIGLAMLVGVLISSLTAGKEALQCGKAFFEGAGYAYARIISLIVCAATFGTGVKAVGLAELLGDFIESVPALLIPLAAFVPLGFGVISGSGMASTASLYGFFYEPSVALQIDPVDVGAIVSLGAAAGRTMSPVAAVNLMSSSLTETSPFELSKRIFLPLLVGMGAVVLVQMFFL